MSPEEKYLGLDRDAALECFDYSLLERKPYAWAESAPGSFEPKTGWYPKA